MPTTQRASVYDRLRPHLDAADLLQRLGITVSRSIGSEAYCAPLCHDSTSGESLQVNLHTGRWNCKACQSSGVYGDLFQLVEYVLAGGAAPSKGNAQGGSSSHRQALLWLCEQFGISFDENRVTGDEGLDVVHLFAMAAHQHLLQSPEILGWVQEKWGFDRATVEAYGIGYMPTPILPQIAAEAGQQRSRAAFRSSGLGWFAQTGGWRSRFEGRVLFPYLEHGRAVYLIGRATPWTPTLDNGARAPKYHKLSVHSGERPYISERVTNDHLYNEPVMSSAESVVVAEGVADAVALSSLGVPVVSPVTISFNAADLERFTKKARKFALQRVEILFDNELSGSGNYAARRVGLKLVERGLVVKILTLPLGEEQLAARDEVIRSLGDELFEELERSDPRRRKELILEAVPDEGKRKWILEHVEKSKIDAAEWTAQVGAGAAGRLSSIRRAGVDVIELEVAELAKDIDDQDDEMTRAGVFSELIDLVAHVEDRLSREGYAGKIAAAAGRGVTKTEIMRRVSDHRRSVVAPARKEEAREDKLDREAVQRSLTLLPPESAHTPAAAPATPVDPEKAHLVPPPPGAKIQNAHERYAPARDAVANALDAKVAEEALGEFVAQTVTRSMGFTPFRTPDELYLVRGSERVPVGLGQATPPFLDLLWLASGLTPKKSSHRSYIAAVVYFLGRDARRAQDVSWSFVDPDGSVFFPTGDAAGSILRIDSGRVLRTRMSDVRVPAVAGDEFKPLRYIEEDGGISDALDVFAWTSISTGDRLVLVYWLVCLPILRRIGTIPIVRIEGGSSSGKTRTVDAVSYLVNGSKSSSVPTAAALVSRMSTEMLTVDDNRETGDVSPAFLGTLLQATHLGAREKRKANSDTGTVVERVCGALLMNGIEPIHDGKSELASRMLTLRCSNVHRSSGSPTAEGPLAAAVLRVRDAFWSEAIRRCAAALELDRTHGEHLGAQLEALFGATKIGRLSTYLRVMVLAWVAGLPEHHRAANLVSIPTAWQQAFGAIASGSLESLLAEELSVAVLRYVFAHGSSLAEPIYTGATELQAFSGKYVEDRDKGEAYLGPVRATQLARLARAAGKDLNAPRQVATDLRAGQLERRLLDGLAFLEAAGFDVQVETTAKGRNRFTFRRSTTPRPVASPPGQGDTWLAP